LNQQDAALSEPNAATGTSRSSKPSNAKTANLQVRLLDGGRIRSQFPAEATLADDIRPWIDSNLEFRAPYTFKHILPPQPARAISVSEEHSSLRALDLLPSATLVLQPVTNYTEAYTGGSDGMLAMPYNAALGAYGIVAGGISAVAGSLTGAARWLRGGLYTEHTLENHDAAPTGQVLGQEADESTRRSGNAATSAASTRVRTLADQRAERGDQQFYNGNSLDFQPTDAEDERR